ncbi:hypothetical protein E8A74_48965, partial [Polyangium fumosum]
PAPAPPLPPAPAPPLPGPAPPGPVLPGPVLPMPIVPEEPPAPSSFPSLHATNAKGRVRSAKREEGVPRHMGAD